MKRIIDYLEQKNIEIKKEDDVLKFKLEKNIFENGINIQINLFLNNELIFIYNKDGKLVHSNIKCVYELPLNIFQLLKEKVMDYKLKEKEIKKIDILNKFKILKDEEPDYYLSKLNI